LRLSKKRQKVFTTHLPYSTEPGGEQATFVLSQREVDEIEQHQEDKLFAEAKGRGLNGNY
jgi:hypothetical protein